MDNNDILRRIRYCFDISNKQMVEIFSFAELKVTEAQLLSWLQKEGEEGYLTLDDNAMAGFLNGFIVSKRGKQEGVAVVNEKRLNNNLILRKLKIALCLTTEDIIELLALAGVNVGKSEINALFQKKEHKNYRPCKNQFLRNVLLGLTKKYRG